MQPARRWAVCRDPPRRALSAELLESELFGHLKGLYRRPPRPARPAGDRARRHPVPFDEVGEMPAPVQVKLLRFLQEGSFSPVGGRELRRAEVRVIAATHRDLEAMVQAYAPSAKTCSTA